MDEQPRDTLLDFLTTTDGGEDRIGTPLALGGWLASHGLLDDASPVSDDDVRQARRLRAALVSLVTANSGGEADARTGPFLQSVSAAAPLIVVPQPGGTLSVQATGSGVSRALSLLLHLTYEATLLGDFDRFKACKSCGWCYYDTTKNRSKRWCDMAGCGSREKTRAYRARKRAASPD